MRVVYDLRILTGRMHGMARYGLRVLDELTRLRPELEIIVLARRPEDQAWLPQDRVRTRLCDLDPYGPASQVLLPGVLKKLAPDLYHCPFYAPPVAYPGAMVMTIHDLIHLRFPSDHGWRFKLFHKLVVGPAARRAALVFTVSQHSKNDLVELLGLNPERITVTLCGVEPHFTPAAAGDLPAGWPQRYVLGVGNPKPHKNLLALVRGHARLRMQAGGGENSPPPLALVGVGPGDLPGVEPGPELILAPHLDDLELARAYARAALVVIPSLYEGFGLPALEAMACGAPVLAARRASLPEVVGEAALLAEPDEASLAQGISRLLSEPELARRLAQAGPARAAGFTWQATARAVLAGYDRLAREGLLERGRS